MKKEQTPAAAVAPDTAAAAAVETVPAPTASIQATEENDQERDEYSEELAKAKTVIVVGIYPGAADIVEKIYKNVPEDVTVVFFESSDTNLGSSLQLVTEALADPAIPEEFIAVPCGCVPCGGVDLDAMRPASVYVQENRRRSPCSTPRAGATADIERTLHQLPPRIRRNPTRKNLRNRRRRPQHYAVCL